MRNRPELDGIRALAVLAVFASHSPYAHAGGGWLGVDAFFVLSGFLITTNLLREHDRTGTVSFRRFYLRRALRLYPALILMIVVVAPFAGYAYTGAADTLRHAAAAGFYLTDLVNGFNWIPLYGPYAHTWSLAIEEQFYLLWPPVLVWFLRRNRGPIPLAIAAIVAGSAVLAVGSFPANISGTPFVYWLPWGEFPQLLLGAVLALAFTNRAAPPWIGRPAVGYGLVVGAAVLWYDAGQQLRIPNLGWQAPLMAVITAALILHLDHASGGVSRALRAAPLVALGRRSYGFYLFHFPIFEILGVHLHVGRVAVLGLAFALTLAVTWASYRFVEQPFLKLKERFEPRPVVPQVAQNRNHDHVGAAE